MYDKTMINKILQHFILGVNDDSLSNNSNIKYCLKNNLGGIIFFTNNIISKKRIKSFVEELKSESSSKLFLSIDQEGGRVERTENIHNGKKYKSSLYILQEGENELKKQTCEIAQELREYGLNTNFAPVADVNSNPNNPIIGERAFSCDPSIVSKCVKLVSQIYLDNGILPVIKHFPGHGDTNMDSHIDLPVVDMDYDTFEKIHVKPFIDNINLPAIMVSHVYYKMFDNFPTPATMSENVIQKYLIEKLNYKGMIVSDDMVMGALEKIDPVERIVRGIIAGLSIFIYRNSNDDTIDTIETAAKEAAKSKFLTARLESASERICQAKKFVK